MFLLQQDKNAIEKKAPPLIKKKKRGASFSPPKVPGALLLQNLDLTDTSIHVRFYVHRLVFIYIKTYFPEFCSNIVFNSPF